MSQVIYNGITLPYPVVTQFDQETQYDDIGQTDWYLTRFTIGVQTIINTNYVNMLLNDVKNNEPLSAAEIMSIVRSRLLTPQKPLRVNYNGVDIVPRKVAGLPGAMSVDAMNGPKPQLFNAMQLTNTTFLVNWKVVAHYWECNRYENDPRTLINQRTSPVLYNRWTETVEIDNRNFSTISRKGKFVIRSDNHELQIVDMYRDQFAVLATPPNFLRVRHSYTVSPDGLGIEYDIQDREVFKMPPQPAFEAEGKYTETAPVRGQAFRFGEAWVRMKGQNNRGFVLPLNIPLVTNLGRGGQQGLLNIAISVVTSKVLIQGVANQRGTIDLPEQFQITTNMYDNEVEVRMRAILMPSGGTAAENNRRIQRIPGFTNVTRLTVTPFSEPGGPSAIRPTYLARGSAGRVLQAAAFFDPCLSKQDLVINQAGQTRTGSEPGKGTR